MMMTTVIRALTFRLAQPELPMDQFLRRALAINAHNQHTIDHDATHTPMARNQRDSQGARKNSLLEQTARIILTP